MWWFLVHAMLSFALCICLQAMEKSGQDLLGRSVNIDLAVDRGTPASKQNWRSTFFKFLIALLSMLLAIGFKYPHH